MILIPIYSVFALTVLLKAACLAEKQQMPILQSLVCPDQGPNPRFAALEMSMLPITPQIHLKVKRTGVCYAQPNTVGG
jgi:hypothetical protein